MKKIAVLLGLAAVFATAAHAQAPAKTLPSGVQVQILKDGSGPHPAPTDVVRVRYRGTLADGTEFDSSARHGDVSVFPLNHLIPCWSQGFAELQPGAKAKLVCPPDTAYGSRAVGSIPPNSTLTFEVELVGIGAGAQ